VGTANFGSRAPCAKSTKGSPTAARARSLSKIDPDAADVSPELPHREGRIAAVVLPFYLPPMGPIEVKPVGSLSRDGRTQEGVVEPTAMWGVLICRLELAGYGGPPA
jgi:hypothetical protein